MNVLETQRTASQFAPHATGRERVLREREIDLKARVEQRRAEVINQGGWPLSDPLYQRLAGTHQRVLRELYALQNESARMEETA